MVDPLLELEQSSEFVGGGTEDQWRESEKEERENGENSSAATATVASRREQHTFLLRRYLEP